MNDLTNAPDTLEKIFPEAKNLEEKALLLFELKDSGASFRSMGRSLGVHHQTVSKLYRYLQDTKLYADYTWEKNEQVKDFLSKDFFSTIHGDYKNQRERVEAMIKRALDNGDLDAALNWSREKRLLLKDMVSTALALTPSDKRAALGVEPDTSEPELSTEDADYKAAVESFSELQS